MNSRDLRLVSGVFGFVSVVLPWVRWNSVNFSLLNLYRMENYPFIKILGIEDMTFTSILIIFAIGYFFTLVFSAWGVLLMAG